jgi:hypothetical protein
VEKLVVDQADGPEVGFVCVFHSGEDLWGHVEWRADDRFHYCAVTVLQVFREAKIPYLTPPLFHQDIRRFEIPMGNLPAHQILKPLHNIPQHFYCLDLSYPLPPLQQASQIALLTVLRHDVHVVRGLVDVVEGDDVLVVEFFHDVNLKVEVF